MLGSMIHFGEIEDYLSVVADMQTLLSAAELHCW